MILLFICNHFLQEMRLAIVHCRIAPGGAFNVLKDLISQEKYSEAKIFTMHSTEEFLTIHNKQIPIIPIIPKQLHFIDHRFWMPFYPIIMKLISRKIKSYNPDRILISSFAIAKNIDYIKNTKLYLHSPMQYIRSHYTEYTHKLTGYKKILFKLVTPYLRKRDLKYKRFDTILANSHYTAQEAKKLYNIDATIHYPTIHTLFLTEQIEQTPLPYYVCVGRLVRFVRECDIIIKLFNHLKQPLLMIGSWPDADYLKSIAGETILFVEQQSPKELISTLKKARGLINLTKESFGLSTAEALCLGIPVFGYNQGATSELLDTNSGILVDNKSLSHLIEKFHEFQKTTRNRPNIAKIARAKFTP